jgi:tuftelin-interacting protein 11
MRLAFRGWRPLRSPAFGVQLMRSWQDALGGVGGGVGGGGGGGGGSYEALVYLAAMPALRGALANEWRVRSSDEAIELLTCWRGVLPDALWHPLLTAQVLPRLASELSAWQPKTDQTPPHLWIHPWLPLLPEAGLAELFPQLRHKLASALATADACSPAPLALLQPWKKVLDPASWHALVGRHALPLLSKALSEDLVINPAEQDVRLVEAVLGWTGTLPTDSHGALITKHFFPPWHRALRLWLGQSPDFEQVAAWFVGWKALLAERAPALLALPSVRAQLYMALETINEALAQVEGDMDGPQPLPPPPPPPPSRETVRVPAGLRVSLRYRLSRPHTGSPLPLTTRTCPCALRSSSLPRSMTSS